MALTIEQQIDIAFKNLNSVSSTGLVQASKQLRQFFEEAFASRPAVLKNSVWTESDLIPLTPADSANPLSASANLSEFVPSVGVVAGSTNGKDNANAVIKKLRVQMNHIAGSTGAFRNNDVSNLLDTTFDSSYAYRIFQNDNLTQISLGVRDWFIDRTSGVLTFFGITDVSQLGSIGLGTGAGQGPYIEFYKYVGTLGDFGSGSAASGGTSLEWRDSVNTTTGIDPGTPLNGDRFLIIPETYAVSGTTSGAPGASSIDVVGDLTTIITSGDTLTYDNSLYTVSAVTFSSPNTTIFVNEALPATSAETLTHASGEFNGQEQEIAQYNSTLLGYEFTGGVLPALTPGTAVLADDELDGIYVFDGTSWSFRTFGAVQAGNGIEITLGNTISVLADGDSIGVTVNGVRSAVLAGADVEFIPLFESKVAPVSAGTVSLTEIIEISGDVTSFILGGVSRIDIEDDPINNQTDVVVSASVFNGSVTQLQFPLGTFSDISALTGNVVFQDVPVAILPNKPSNRCRVMPFINGVLYKAVGDGTTNAPFYFADPTNITTVKEYDPNSLTPLANGDRLIFRRGVIDFDIEQSDDLMIVYQQLNP